ncbi:hypothetical protein MetfoDRAFT_0712 [Methanotorris formicicus Mc-S-70]|uniref:Uncharacterized protein n=1 Tax=Methanotorris formicicus Mc-S-70 TaxID=647171 RepID=H1KY39_9EURY|nr:hypothetical protein MetfoDRAFT_0712 [Methanotorris formicicus Mc-S-70]
MIDLEGKVAVIHAIGGAVAGYLTNYVYTVGLGSLSGIVAFIFMIVALLITGHITAILFGRESMNQKQWFGSGVVPFFFVWAVFWVLKFNGVI